MNNCPSCCLTCNSTSPQRPSSVPSPYSLSNFLPAGTVQVSLNGMRPVCLHAHAEDGWHVFLDLDLDLDYTDSESDLFKSLRFLVEQHFVAATYRLAHEQSGTPLLIRIYLIPYDLPGVNGRLTYNVRKREQWQVLSLARQYMSKLLPQIIQDEESWTRGRVQSTFNSIIDYSVDRRTLSEIYSDLPSPALELSDQSSSLIRRLLNFDDPLANLGLRSTLLRYQRESVAAMLEREESSRLDTPNPLYVPLKGLDGRVFFYQPGTTEILREQSVVSLPCGGVLCEELGTGKTVMVLALVLGTLREFPAPEESVIDTRPVLTPLAFRHFPSGEFSSTRERMSRSSRSKKPPVEHDRVPTFREILLHQLCINPDSQVANDEKRQFLSETFEQLPMYDLWKKANTPFYFHFQDDYQLTDFRTSHRGRSNPGPRIMYLSAATLIVVPPNLIGQWDREIHKHCEETPRTLIVRSKTVLPQAKDLAADYDLILMSYPRLCDEDRKSNITKLHSWKTCKCPEFTGSRVPNCQCTSPDVSPLLQIRWKRLVIDEGHVSSSLSTRLTPFTKLLSVQARWIVSGTPTTNLLGLSFGGSGTEEEAVATPSASQSEQVFADPLLHSQSEEDSLFGDSEDEDSLQFPISSPRRIWTSSDNQDIQKLMNMVSQFIGVKFLADSQVIKTHLKDALFAEDGPRPEAVNMLVQVMKTVMIRHRISDVEKEITLPRLTQECVLLELHPYSVISYNALQAAIAINAIDSERTDKDYIFHPSNTEYLQLTLKNMSQLMFYSVDSNLYNVEEIVENTEKMLIKVNDKEKHLSEQDIALARESLHHANLAVHDSLWRRVQMHEDVPYQVFNLPPSILSVWSRLATHNNSQNATHLIHPDRLIRLRQHVILRPLSDEAKLCALGSEIAEADILNRRLLEELERTKGSQKDKLRLRSASHKSQFATGISTGTNDLKVVSAARNVSAVDRIKEVQQELQIALARLDDFENEGLGTHSTSPATLPTQPSALLHQSPVAHTRVGKTASSKLNYIIGEVQKYAAEEKFLIFSESPLTLAHVYEALNLLQIKCLQFTTQTSALIREQFVLTFETSDVYRVFLMELKHSARGLNLVSASRVIFCEPVWQADVESQAIKRAHRIGQIRPVTVKTLAIRGTAEEKMMERRQALKTNGSKVPKLIEEAGMRSFIEHPEFLRSSQSGDVTSEIDFPLFHLPPINQLPTTTTPSTPTNKRIRLLGPRSPTADDTSLLPSKTKRAVHFG